MTKAIFKIKKNIDFENEAGLLIFNYTDYLAHSNPQNIDWKDSYVNYKNSAKEVVQMEDIYHSYPAYMNFLREVRSEAYFLIEEFFDEKNEDILNLFYIYEEGDENYFPFMLSIFQNLDRKNNNGLTYDFFKELYDIFFYQYLGLDYLSLGEIGIRTYEELKEYMDSSKMIDYISNSPFTDKETMTLLRAYQNTDDMYQRLMPLLNKLSKIIEDKVHLLDDLICESYDKLVDTNYKIAYDFAKQVGLDEMINTADLEIPISILLFAPHTQMFRYVDFNGYTKAVKLGVLVDKYENNEESHKLLSISQYLTVISDQTRIQILDYLKESDYYAKELSDKLYITPATLSYHLNKLLICGFVGIRKEGRKYYYYLRKNGFEYLIDNLTKFSEDIKENDHGEK
ncbi:winged helix-turn-helix domain-containing protein [Anaerococcus sp. Marseille-Q7828]|uniref:ArsR/SmtB family transcription factor n=1 Tax=Anaerococcus sp. Marseille-Q7828 TaxID=3036300 RepID=UPI0024AE6355|nr:winged helix-turn-helix domain-containing protein [Anaerococcus sp. Marseille-Q7828]